MIFKKTIKLIVAVTKYIMSGEENVSFDEYTERINICNQCEHRNKMECEKCGCLLTEKAWLSTEHCPLKKW